MRMRFCATACAAALVIGTGSFVLPLRADSLLPAGRQAPDETPDTAGKPILKPDIAALIKKSTAVYTAIKTYRHTSECVTKGQGPEGELNNTQAFTLSLERPNKFCYKSDLAEGSAAVSDGKTFINYRNDDPGQHDHAYYTRTSAPATYKGINIVDDVTFVYGSYMVALMLQGDVLADREIKTGLEQATLRAGVMNNGKKYDILSVPFQEHSLPFKTHIVQFYFDTATSLLHKTVEEVSGEGPRQPGYKQIEILENVLIDKPLPPSTFDYKPPKNARLIVGLPASPRRPLAFIHTVPSESTF